jgi:anti-sigma-K factor RskA
MTHEPFEDQAAAYALGALDGEERTAFEAHLAAGCPHCERVLRESREALAAVARSLPPEAPPPAVREALRRRLAVEGSRVRTPRVPGGWRPWAAVAAAAGVAATLAGLWVAGRYERRLESLAREVEGVRSELLAARRALGEAGDAARALADLLRDPATRVVVLRGAGPAASAQGRVVWHERAGGYLLATNLPPPGPGRTYELWVLSGGMPRPAGTFEVGPSGEATVGVAPAGSVDAFAVTVEPAGGVPAPTGPVVLASR